MIKCFLDSNVIANWMLTKLSIRERKEELSENELLKDIKKRHLKAYSCYVLLEYVRKNREEVAEFFISDLVLNEITSVIIEKYIIEEILKSGISIKYFQKFKESINLPYDNMVIIHNLLYNFKSSYVDSKKVGLVNKINYFSIKSLIGSHKLDSHDSFLVNQANTEKCKYFVTADERLRKLVKKYGKTALISPETILSELKIKS